MVHVISSWFTRHAVWQSKTSGQPGEGLGATQEVQTKRSKHGLFMYSVHLSAFITLPLHWGPSPAQDQRLGTSDPTEYLNEFKPLHEKVGTNECQTVWSSWNQQTVATQSRNTCHEGRTGARLCKSMSTCKVYTKPRFCHKFWTGWGFTHFGLSHAQGKKGTMTWKNVHTQDASALEIHSWVNEARTCKNYWQIIQQMLSKLTNGILPSWRLIWQHLGAFRCV